MAESKISNWGVIIFPGSNCDHDAIFSLGSVLGQNVRPIWHKENDLGNVDGVILPGGFSYGDYLRSGAIAKFSPVMRKVNEFADNGGLVIGICNGFQILTEAGLLPGVLLRNKDLRFICREIYIRVERNDTCFTSHMNIGDVLKIPIAHNEGNFYLTERLLKDVENKGQVIFRYCDENGEVNDVGNVNGSLNNIAGIINDRGNVLGMMPHPERRCDPLLGRPDGRNIFSSAIKHLTGS